MDVPTWQQDEAAEEAEYQRLLHEQGLHEEAQRDANLYLGDDLGLEDGRPGISVDPASGNVYMPLHWRLILWAVGVVLLAALAFGARLCVGEQRAQEILHGQSQNQPK